MKLETTSTLELAQLLLESIYQCNIVPVKIYNNKTGEVHNPKRVRYVLDIDEVYIHID